MTTSSHSGDSLARPSWSEGLGPMAVLLAVHFVFLALFFAPAISTPDANGYLAQARLIAKEGRTDIVVESPAQYVGDHWMTVGEGRYFGQYPPGLPAILAVAYRTISPNASLWVIPIMGTLTLLGLFLVVREWVGSDWALLAALFMAVNPFSNAHALGADSHTAVCFFLIWGLYGLVMWDRTRRSIWAVLCGFCLGIIPSIRYAEALFLIAAGVYVLSAWKRADGVKSLVAGVIGALVPMAALAARNQYAFGKFWKTGYSISGEQTGFGLGYFARYSIPYLALVLAIGAFVLLPIGVRGMISLWKQPATKRRGQLLVGLTLPITLLYMAYYWPPGHNSMRFLLPTFFIYAIAGVYFLAIRTEELPAKGRKLTKIVTALVLIWGIPLSIFEVSSLKRDNELLSAVTRDLQDNVEPGSVLIAQSGLQQHLDFVGDWRLAPEEAFNRAPRPPRPLGPPDAFDDTPEPPAEQLTPLERSQNFRKQVASWSRGDKIYWLTSEKMLHDIAERLGNEEEFIRVTEIEVPGQNFGPPPGGPEGPGPDGPGGRRRGPFGFGGGPPPGGPGGPGGRRGGPGGGGPPPRFRPPVDGKFILVEWRPSGK